MDFSIGNTVVKTGEKKLVPLVVNTEEAGQISISVMVVNGRKDGPKFLAMAGEHGIEVNGSVCVQKAAAGLSPEGLAGTFIGIPYVNPLNIRARRHFLGQKLNESPWDFKATFNTCHKWPGRPDGDAGERITHKIYTEILRKVDYVLNLHGWHMFTASSIFFYTAYPKTIPMAKNFGLKFYHLGGNLPVPDDPAPTHSYLFANRSGITSCLVELNTQWALSLKSITDGTRGIYNLLKYFNMLAGKPELPAEQFYTDGTEEIIRAGCPGVFMPGIELEKFVKKGDLLGELLDTATLKINKIISPAEGGVWAIGRFGSQSDVNLESQHAYAEQGDIVAIIKKVRKENN